MTMSLLSTTAVTGSSVRMTSDKMERSHVVARNPPAHGVRQQDMTVMFPANTCKQEEQACSQSSAPPSTSEVREGSGRILMARTLARQ